MEIIKNRRWIIVYEILSTLLIIASVTISIVDIENPSAITKAIQYLINLRLFDNYCLTKKKKDHITLMSNMSLIFL